MESYRAASWLPNGHLQTIYAALFAPRPRVALRRTRWQTPDHDFIDLDWLTMSDANTPLVVLFHGLEGSSRSHYARSLMYAVAKRGWNGVVVHFRGCSGEPNRLARAYHSGDAAEIDWVLKRLLHEKFGHGPLLVVGVSLGGNALLKWLGEYASASLRTVTAACSVSAPLDLVAAGNALDQGFNRAVYTRNFLRTLKRKSLAKLAEFPQLFDLEAVRRADTLRAFDDAVTAPIHGFRDAQDYWTRSSSKPWLAHIRVQTLVLNARDDPFLPGWALPQQEQVSVAVRLEFPPHGGHVGFVSGAFPGTIEWMPQRILDFFDENLSAVHRI